MLQQFCLASKVVVEVTGLLGLVEATKQKKLLHTSLGMVFWGFRFGQASGRGSGFASVQVSARLGGCTRVAETMLQVWTGRELAEALGGKHEPTSPGS